MLNRDEIPSENMTTSNGRTEQIAIRLPHKQITRLKELREALTRPGLEAPSLAEVFRAVCLRGLDSWEKELGTGTPVKPAKAGKK
jgi:hypothetical protein